MTDLDKQIAEAKGWKVITAAGYEKMTGRPAPLAEVAIKEVAPTAIVLGTEHGIGGWSTSDSKALELVDELGQRFTLQGQGSRWVAAFWMLQPGKEDHIPHLLQEEGATRPEAICRAWLAAMTWLKERKA